MNWKLSRISIPVFDLETSKTFYNSILNNQTKNNHHHLDTDEECFISGGNIDLRLYKLKNEVSNNYILQSRRTFPTLAFNNLDLIVKDLEGDGINFSLNKHNKSIILQEPGLNYIELISEIISLNILSLNLSYLFLISLLKAFNFFLEISILS